MSNENARYLRLAAKAARQQGRTEHAHRLEASALELDNLHVAAREAARSLRAVAERMGTSASTFVDAQRGLLSTAEAAESLSQPIVSHDQDTLVLMTFDSGRD